MMGRAFSTPQLLRPLTQAAAELRSRFGLGWDDGAPLALMAKRDEPKLATLT